MSLAYDFDIVQSDAGKYIALFREPETAAALKGADFAVRSYFKESGFGFLTHDSGAGRGRYPLGDEEARIAVIRRLGDTMWRFDLTGADMNGFDFGDFLAHLSEAEPVDMRHSAFSIGLPVERLTRMFRRARPSRILTRPLF